MTGTGDTHEDARRDGADDEPTVPIRCDACGTTTRVRLSALADTIDRHNENRHDGEELAEVAPGVADHLADLVARDLGLLDEE